MQTVFISLGSNLGKRKARLDMALECLALHPEIELETVSDYITTKPVDMPFTGHFVNAVARLGTTLSPKQFLGVIHSIETKCGRGSRPTRRFLPRDIDIDILFFGNMTINTKDLTVPHPRMHERDFVLGPLGQIAPEMLEKTAEPALA